MFGKILVANRGEIAVRIIQTCHEMEVLAIAVYSEADAEALHVRRADEAYAVGSASALESYLSIPAIIQAARASGADAVHPGYGFLAENPAFARAVQAAGLVWIGPDPDVIALLGDKVAAKELAHTAGVPVIPGYYGEDHSIARIKTEAAAIGYPVMLKAAAGGGGKGMRAVRVPADLGPALEGAKREARSAFGDDRIFLEKLIVGPRHIEMQILLDGQGNGVYLGERECSLQRRHQKVIEESPSPVLTPALRTLIGDDSLRVARASGYRNAGTVEFLFSGDRYYFLEVNTRIQVEHPVTEMVTGLDIVRRQIEIAAGESLGLSQLDVVSDGHAIEVRLYAEDPENNFLPATGTLTDFRPALGAGIRNDVGVTAGSVVAPYYDPLLAKLIVHAADRDLAVRRLRDALQRYVVLGCTTNLSFLLWISEQSWFREGRVSTGTLEQEWTGEQDQVLPENVLIAAAGYQMLAIGPALPSPKAPSPWRQTSGWRPGGAQRTFSYTHGDSNHTVALQRGADGWQATVNGNTIRVDIRRAADGEMVLRDGPVVWTAAVGQVGDRVTVLHAGTRYRLDKPSRDVVGRISAPSAKQGLMSPMPGTVVKVAVTEGQHVTAHEPLVVVEAMKMEHVIEAPHEGTVAAILYREGDLVPANEPVVRLEQA